MIASSETVDHPASNIGTSGWCAIMDDDKMPTWIQFTFDEAKIIERIRLEKAGDERKSFVTGLSLSFANDTGIPLTSYKRPNGTVSMKSE